MAQIIGIQLPEDHVPTPPSMTPPAARARLLLKVADEANSKSPSTGRKRTRPPAASPA
jgi:hypothetical protein